MRSITFAIVALVLGVLVSSPAAATGQTDSPIGTPTPTPFISVIETPMPTAIVLRDFRAR